MAASLPYRNEIDGLRAVAVLAVVLFHAGFGLPGGFAGVDVFFVLSGTLITRLLMMEMQADTFHLIHFYERRIRRLLPALWTVCTATVLGSFWFGLPTHREDVGKTLFAAVWLHANQNVAARIGYFAPDAEFMPLLHLWSLSVEEQFYLGFPMLLWLLKRWNRVQTGLLFLLGGSFVWSVLFHTGDEFFALSPRIWELLVGAVVALSTRPMEGRPARAVAWVSALGVALTFLLLDDQSDWPGPWTCLPVLSTAGLLLSTERQDTFVRRLLSSRPAVHIGRLSYAWYLWHWPVLVFLRMKNASIHLPWTTAASGLVVSLGLAYLTFHYIEAPIRSRRRTSNRRANLVGGLGALLLMGTAAVLVQFDGFVNAAPNRVRLAIDAKNDTDPAFVDCPQGDGGQPGCRLGSPTRPIHYVLWGDSHAPAIRPAVEHALQDQAGALWWHNSCPALLGAHLVGHPEDANCTKSRAAFLQWLDRHPDVEQVVVAGRWLPVFGRLKEVGGQPHVFLQDTQTTRISAEQNLAVFERSIGRTLTALRTRNVHVVWLGGIPEPGQDVPTIQALADLHRRDHPPSLDRAEVESDYRPIDRRFQKYAQTSPSVSYIPLWRGLCDDTQCKLSEAGHPRYFDDDHLTTSAARSLGPWLAARWPEP